MQRGNHLQQKLSGLNVGTWFKRTHYEGADITTNPAVLKGKASAVLKHFIFH